MRSPRVVTGGEHGVAASGTPGHYRGRRLLTLGKGRQYEVIDKPRSPHVCGDCDQRAFGGILDRLEAFRVYDFEVVEANGFFLGNFCAATATSFAASRSPASHRFF